jgi:hypothetical protein
MRESAKGAILLQQSTLAKRSAWLPAMMKWSSTLTSMSASASFRLAVSNSSAWLG